MRIISGERKGRLLEAPAGLATRPTSDRARQTLFNILDHAAFAPSLGGARVLDLCAGSGALGLEALSRGAASAVFVERDPAALKALRRNVEGCGFAPRARIAAVDVLAWRPAAGAEPVSIVFADPPYGTGLGLRALSRLEPGWLTVDTVAVLEDDAAQGAPAAPDGWTLRDWRATGRAGLAFLTRAG